MKIALCVSVPNGGEDLLGLLAQSAALTQSGEHDVVMHLTSHNDVQKAVAVEVASRSIEVEGAHVVPREEGGFPHAGSVTHSRCINALFAAVDADVSIICDYDGALVAQGWDRIVLEQVVDRQAGFFGAPYSDGPSIRIRLASGTEITASKYQRLPNCIFIAFETARIRRLTDHLCDFAELYDTADALPIQFVSNRRESERVGLPIGSFLHVDTGTRITRLIQEHGMSSGTLERIDSGLTTLAVPESMSELMTARRPEEYLFSGRPFFTHFRKATAKMNDLQEMHGGYPAASFIRDIEAYLRRAQSR